MSTTKVSGVDMNGLELVLDADADTTITADTDDTIDIKIAGADDFQFTANTFTVLSGSTLTVASGATIANSGTATGFGGSDPSSADGDTLGTASLEWSDLYLADGSVIYFGNDQEVKVTHVADTGLTLKHTATADDKPISLTLQTGETDIAADDVLGKISFQAPDEGTGTDAVLVAAAIQAVSEGDFSSSSNATKLSFMTGASEAATEKMAISSAGDVTINSGNLVIGTAGKGIDFAAVADNAGMDGELLDKYERGTYVTALTGATSGTMDMNGDYGTLSYRVVGNVCHVQGIFIASGDNSLSGVLRMSLPFTAIANEGTSYSSSTYHMVWITGHGDGGMENPACEGGGNTAFGAFYNLTDTGGAEAIDESRLDAGFYCSMNLFYAIA